MNYRFLINIMIVFTLLVGQVSIESTPKSFSLEQSVEIETQILPAFDIQKFIEEDEMERTSSQQKPYRFANLLTRSASLYLSKENAEKKVSNLIIG